jgi:predicted lipoprotein with Yx(FWY)xxD motif
VQVVQNASLGSILVDSRGMTLYRFTPDQPNVSNCNGQCATVWPPLLLAQGNPVAGPGAAGTLGVITRQDGGRQVTYNGLPLYIYSLDTKPGDVNGQGVQNIWYVVKTTDSAMAASSPAQPGSSASAGSWYTVQPGQTLAMLGRMFGVNAYAICSANQLANCNYIQAGQTLWIPSGSYGSSYSPSYQQPYSSPSYQQPYSYSAPYANRPYSYSPSYRMPYSYSTPYMNQPYSYSPSYRMPYSYSPSYRMPYSYSTPYTNRPYSYSPSYRMPYSYSTPYMNRPYSYVPSYRQPYSYSPNHMMRSYSYSPSPQQPYPYSVTQVNWPYSYSPFMARPFMHPPFTVRRFFHPPFTFRRFFYPHVARPFSFAPFAMRPFAHPLFHMNRFY